MHCAICIMEAEKDNNKSIAIVIVGGFSVCATHGILIINEIEAGRTSADIVYKATRDRYKAQ